MRAFRLLFASWRRIDPSAPFTERCSALKNKFRGKGQYSTSKAEAANFLKENLNPNLDTWLTVSNAAAALSVCSFFEIDHSLTPEIGAWLASRLSNLSAEEKIEAGQALIQADLAKYRDTVRASVILPLTSNLTGLSTSHISVLVKMMQRCGSDIPGNLFESVAEAIKVRLSEITTSEALRFFSAFSRAIPNNEVTKKLFEKIMECIDRLSSFDYSTLLYAVSKMHTVAPIDLKVFRRLAFQAGEYGNRLNCRDTGTILSTIMRMRASYKTSLENIDELWAVDNTIQVLLFSLNRIAIRYMDKNDEMAWSSQTDVVALIFAFESSGCRFDVLFRAFNNYIRASIDTIEGRNLALSLGILRRTGYLDDELAAMFSKRIAEVIDDFVITELAHVVFTYLAVRGESPPWIDRARARIVTLLTETTPPHALINIRVSFPGETALVRKEVELRDISFRQLYDILKATNVNAEFRKDVEIAFKDALNTLIAPNCAEVEVILEVYKGNFMGLKANALSAAKRITDFEHWPVDIAALVAVFEDQETRDKICKKAVDSAIKSCESATQFVTMANRLLTIFPSSAEVRSWVKTAAGQLTKPRVDVSLFAALSLFELCSSFAVEMPSDWYKAMVFGPISDNATTMTIPEIATFFKLLKDAKVPAEDYREPINFLLNRAISIHRDVVELVPVLVAAAALGSVPLDKTTVQRVLSDSRCADGKVLKPEEKKLLESVELSDVYQPTRGGERSDAIPQTFEDSSSRGYNGNGRGGKGGSISAISSGSSAISSGSGWPSFTSTLTGAPPTATEAPPAAFDHGFDMDHGHGEGGKAEPGAAENQIPYETKKELPRRAAKKVSDKGQIGEDISGTITKRRKASSSKDAGKKIKEDKSDKGTASKQKAATKPGSGKKPAVPKIRVAAAAKAFKIKKTPTEKNKINKPSFPKKTVQIKKISLKLKGKK